MEEVFTIKQLKKTLRHQRLSVVAYGELKSQVKAMKYLQQLEVTPSNLMYSIRNGLKRAYCGTLSDGEIQGYISETIGAIRKENNNE